MINCKVPSGYIKINFFFDGFPKGFHFIPNLTASKRTNERISFKWRFTMNSSNCNFYPRAINPQYRIKFPVSRQRKLSNCGKA